MHRWQIRTLRLLFAALVTVPLPAVAQTIDAVGTRALGMGGAFVAVADDASAVYWNPAGLATGGVFSLVIDRQSVSADGDPPAADRASSGSGWIFTAGTLPLGLSYYRLRSTAVGPGAGLAPGTVEVRSLVTHHTGVTVLQSLSDHFVLGSTAKIVRGVSAAEVVTASGSAEDALGAASDLIGKASTTFDIDVGAMASFPYFRAGVVARNLSRPGFDSRGGSRLHLDRQVRAGLAALPDDALTLALDLDLTRTTTVHGPLRELAAGAERRWGQRLAARGGVHINTAGSDRRPSGSAGLSVAVRGPLWIDGQVTRGSDHGWGIAARIGL